VQILLDTLLTLVKNDSTDYAAVESGSVDSTVETIKAKHELVYAVPLHPDSPPSLPPPPPPPSPPPPSPLTPGYSFTSFCAKTENDSFLSNLRPLLFTD